jgi:hypothetical protein
MHNEKSHPAFSRRNFLKLTAAVGAVAVGGHLALPRVCVCGDALSPRLRRREV